MAPAFSHKSWRRRRAGSCPFCAHHHPPGTLCPTIKKLPKLLEFYKMCLHYIIGNSIAVRESTQPFVPLLPVEVRGGTGIPNFLVTLWPF